MQRFDKANLCHAMMYVVGQDFDLQIWSDDHAEHLHPPTARWMLVELADVTDFQFHQDSCYSIIYKVVTATDKPAEAGLKIRRESAIRRDPS